jgi:hypothetical protein
MIHHMSMMPPFERVELRSIKLRRRGLAAVELNRAIDFAQFTGPGKPALCKHDVQFCFA